MISRTLESQLKAAEEQDTSELAPYRNLVLYHHLGLADAEAAQIESLRTSGSSSDSTEMMHARLMDLYDAGEALDEESIMELRAGLGYYGKLASLHNMQAGEAAGADEAEKVALEIASRAYRTAVVFMAAAMAFILASIVGFFILLMFGLSVRSGSIRSALAPPQTKPELYLETFTLYFAMMSIAHWIAPSLASRIGGSGGILVSFGLQLLVPVLACYPLLAGARRDGLAADLGLVRGKGIAVEAVLGPLAYMATLPVIIFSMIAILPILQKLGFDIAGGAHPIVGSLKGEGARPLMIALTLFVAVVMAPLVEELMFRGYFYRALRSRWGMIASVAISAAVFAGIHPQGPIGFPLLFVIGTTLAVLREWRGSLLASLAAHATTNAVSMMVVMAM